MWRPPRKMPSSNNCNLRGEKHVWPRVIQNFGRREKSRGRGGVVKMMILSKCKPKHFGLLHAEREWTRRVSPLSHVPTQRKWEGSVAAERERESFNPLGAGGRLCLFLSPKMNVLSRLVWMRHREKLCTVILLCCYDKGVNLIFLSNLLWRARIYY